MNMAAARSTTPPCARRWPTHRPRGDRQAPVRRLGVTEPLQTSTRTIVKRYFDRHAGVRAIQARPRPGRQAADGRRLRQGLRRHLRQERPRLSVHGPDHGGYERRALIEQILQTAAEDRRRRVERRQQRPATCSATSCRTATSSCDLCTDLERIRARAVQPLLQQQHPDERQRVLGQQHHAHEHPRRSTRSSRSWTASSTTTLRKQAGQAQTGRWRLRRRHLPLDPLPDILLWNNKVVGPIADNAIARTVLQHQPVGRAAVAPNESRVVAGRPSG